MGNIAFNVEKLVDLNKVVTLDIDKNVDVTVDNPDILATAEADAEAFGSNALAEVDAFTYVSGETVVQQEDVVVDVDALGNTTLTDQTNLFQESFDLFDSDGNFVRNATYSIPNDITVNFDTPDGAGLPDIDDLNWTGGLEGNETIPGADTQLPTEGFVANDKDLVYLETVGAVLEPNNSVVVTARYQLANPWVVDFSPPDRTITGQQVTETDSLSIEIPQDTIYLVEFLDEDGDDTTGVGGFEAKEYEFESFPADGPGQWVFGGDRFFDIDVYVQTGDEIFDVGFGDWAFEALGTITIMDGSSEEGEAFAYAESTSALDLNGDGTDVL